MPRKPFLARGFSVSYWNFYQILKNISFTNVFASGAPSKILKNADHPFLIMLGIPLKHALQYEAVSDQGPVWVRSEEKIPSGFKSTPNIIFSMPRSSLVTQLSEKVWHVYSQNEWLRRYMGLRPKNLPFFIKICESFLEWLLLNCSFLAW